MKKMTKNFKHFVLLTLVAGVLGSVSPSVGYAEDSAPVVPAGSAPVAAQASGQTAMAANPQQPGVFGMMVPFIAIFAVMYFLMIRPQQKRLKEQQTMLAALKHGDEVVTSSGMLGKIAGIADKVVTLEVADNVRVRLLKSQVAQVVKGPIKDLQQT